MAQVTGVVSQANNPNQWGKFAINVDGNWYSTNPDWIALKPNAGDEVTFDDGGKKYIKNLQILKEGSGAPATSGGKKGGYSSLGVELGHASNIAKDMANKIFADVEVGSEDWYKFWMTHTQKVYKTMKALRDKYENEAVAVPAASPESNVVVLKKSASKTAAIEDIFA